MNPLITPLVILAILFAVAQLAGWLERRRRAKVREQRYEDAVVEFARRLEGGGER